MYSTRTRTAAFFVLALGLVSYASAGYYPTSRSGEYIGSNIVCPADYPYRSYCTGGSAGLVGYACFDSNVVCCGCYDSTHSPICTGCNSGDVCPTMSYGSCFSTSAPTPTYSNSMNNFLRVILPIGLGAAFLLFVLVFVIIRCRRYRAAAAEAESYAVINHYESPSQPPVSYAANYGTTEQTNYVTYDAASGQYVHTTETVEYQPAAPVYQQAAPIYQQTAPVYHTGGATHTTY